MVDWRDQIRPASWRGIRFFVQSSSIKAGRRTARHEYPLRNDPAVEDLGRATREFRLDGFVVGDDYMLERDRILESVEKPGSGVLVHPYFGRLSAVCEACEISETMDEGRAAAVRFVFVESGSLKFPTARPLGRGMVTGAAANLKKSASDDFLDRFNSLLGDLDDAVEAVAVVLDVMIEALNTPGAIASGVFGTLQKIDSLAADAATLLTTPDQFVTSVKNIVEGLGDFYMLRGFVTGATVADSTHGATPYDIQTNENHKAIERLFKRFALAELGLAVSDLSFASFDEAENTRDELSQLVAVEESTADGLVYGDLVDLRTGIYEVITTQNADLARLESIEVTEPIPACVLAYELYDDPTRDAEIADRNKILDPLFSAGDLRVLSK